MGPEVMERLMQRRFYPLLVWAGHLALLGIGVYLLDHLSKPEIKNLLKHWIPWGLRLNAVLVLLAILPCLKDLKEAARGLLNRRGLLLGAVVLFAFLMTAFTTTRTHRIYYDEDIYCNVAQNMALAGKTGFCNYGTFEYGEYSPHWLTLNKEPSGWPFLVSLVFQAFGVNEQYAFLLNNVLFAAAVLVTFFIGRQIAGEFFPGLLAALAYQLMPHNLIWFNTAAAEPAASLWAGLVVLVLFVFLRKGQDRHLFLLALLLPMACQMRMESILLIPLLLLAVLLLAPRLLLSRRIWSFGPLSTLFLLPHLLQFYAVSGHTWGAKGSAFALSFLRPNLAVNGLYYLKNQEFPLILTLLATAGLLLARGRARWLLLTWFLLFWGIFLFFYAGSYHYGADVRFALLAFMPLAVLAGMGAGRLRALLARVNGPARAIESAILIVLVFSFLRFLPLVRREGQEAWGARYDHAHAHAFLREVPERAIILTQTPTMFLLWGQNAIQTYAGINNPGLIKDLLKRYQGHVYFHENYWCNTQNVRNRRLCQAIREKYDLEEVAAASEQHYRYGLYKLSMKPSE